MKRGLSTKKATKEESAWIDRIKRRGCICCISLGYEHEEGGSVVDAHHLLSGSRRIGHMSTVGLCKWHHTARLIVSGWDHAMHRYMLGPSLAEGSIPFHEEFGDDEALMQLQIELLNN